MKTQIPYGERPIFKRKEYIILVLLLLVCFMVLQWLTPTLENSSVAAKTSLPSEINTILESSCFNCHSDHADLRWYDKVAPASWLVGKDIRRARDVLNFSKWDSLPPQVKKVKLWAMLNMIKAGKMPLPHYTALHTEAKVSTTESRTLENYIRSLQDSAVVRDTARIINASIQYDNWLSFQKAKENIPVSPNGIIYSDDYKDWTVITASTFPDNTMRITYANPIAVQAIKEENFFPWPDGATVVKAVWEQVEDTTGAIAPGKFINVQFMVMDHKKYEDTEGWGFAKFSTLELTPYGKDASFGSVSCISCHRQLAEQTGYLFNVPPKRTLVNTTRTSRDNIEKDQKNLVRIREIFEVKNQRVITSVINPKEHTMAVLYGNAAAYETVLRGDHNFMGSEKYTYVTWSYGESPHWIGSNMTDNLLSVEKIGVEGAQSNSPVFSYNFVHGKQPSALDADPLKEQRIRYILTKKASVFP